MAEQLIYLDEDKLLYLLTQLKDKFLLKSDKVTIETEISDSSLNTDAAGAQAVYDFVMDAISGVTGVTFKKVDSLKSPGESNIIYLVPSSSSSEQNIYDEYIWLSDASSFEKIGTTAIDLSDYLRKDEIRAITNGEIDAAISGAGL